MAHIFNYAVLMAVPDARRGERVNVGILVFLRDRVDARFSEVRKLRALKGGNWERYIADVQQRVASNYPGADDLKTFVRSFSMLEGIIRCSELAWFMVDELEHYEQRVHEILSSLVQRERPERKPPSTRINTEIARTFRQGDLLAGRDQTIDSGKILQNLPVSPEDELTADFALKNGVYHVTATLDLRSPNVDKGRAAIKALTLDRARRTLGDGIRRIGVYAAPHDATQYRPHIHMLGEYSDETYNWSDPREQQAYVRSMYHALRGSDPFALISS